MSGIEWFVVLTFIHFVVDWVFQTHGTAMRKHSDPEVRGYHCIAYTLPFLYIVAFVAHINCVWIVVTSSWLWVTHFLEDTYLPVYWWARYIRKVPVVREKGIEGFKEWVATPLGAILMVGIDQIIHVSCLLPVALVLPHIHG